MDLLASSVQSLELWMPGKVRLLDCDPNPAHLKPMIKAKTTQKTAVSWLAFSILIP
jgi:hypothetical protein